MKKNIKNDYILENVDFLGYKEKLPYYRICGTKEKRLQCGIQCLPPDSYVLRFLGKFAKIVNEKRY